MGKLGWLVLISVWPLIAVLAFTLGPLIVPIESDLGNVWLLETNTGQCTAFPVACNETDDGSYEVLFLTAGHCLGTSSKVSHRNGTLLEDGRIKSTHAQEDVILLEFDSPFPIKPRRLSFNPLAYGEEVIVEGYPLGEGPFISRGYGSGERRYSAIVYLGHSGGPVSRMSGEVIGIGTLMLTGSPVGAKYLPLSAIEEWLTDRLENAET